MIITVEKFPNNALTFAYIWRGEPNEDPPVKEFHTLIEGAAGAEEVRLLAHQWVAAQTAVAGLA